MFKCISLQFIEDLSDRQLKKFLQENTASKWYCNFYLNETTPDYTVLSKMRSRPGTTLLSKKLAKIKKQHKKQSYKREIFSIGDASHIVSKVNIWQKRDKAIEKKKKLLNNKTLHLPLDSPHAKTKIIVQKYCLFDKIFNFD